MRPLSPQAIRSLKLDAAALRESRAKRNLLPPEPTWLRAPADRKLIVRMVESQLGSGLAVHPVTEVAARKSRHGLRPLPFLGLVERVAYSALAAAATSGMKISRRTPDDWLAFSAAPATYGASLGKDPDSEIDRFFQARWMSSPVKYIVKTDVVAFYQHIDHEILYRELIARGANFEVAKSLIELLGEIQGRAVGLPQLYDSSDVLSEIYIDAAERAMIRKGYAVWRFNDDFRIATMTYTAALRAIEDLDSCLRRIGLTINEVKTSTPRFESYYLDVMGLKITDAGDVIQRQEVEDIVGDYTDDFTKDADAAAGFIDRLEVGERIVGDQIDIRFAAASEVRVARRALAGLAVARDGRALEKVPTLIRYLAELTPAAINYVLALHSARKVSRTRVADVLDELTGRTATNDWQRMWIVRGYLGASLLSLKRRRSARVEWLRSCTAKSFSEPLRAYAGWTLAQAGEVLVSEVLSQAQSAPRSLQLYYADSASTVGTESDKKIRSQAFGDDQLLAQIAGS